MERNLRLRLFIVCPNCRAKIYLDTTARVRAELPAYFEIKCFTCNYTALYNSSQVLAEPTGALMPTGVIVGGVGGAIIGGPIGALIGAAIGASAGSKADSDDREAAERFNNS